MNETLPGCNTGVCRECSSNLTEGRRGFRRAIDRLECCVGWKYKLKRGFLSKTQFHTLASSHVHIITLILFILTSLNYFQIHPTPSRLRLFSRYSWVGDHLLETGPPPGDHDLKENGLSFHQHPPVLSSYPYGGLMSPFGRGFLFLECNSLHRILLDLCSLKYSKQTPCFASRGRSNTCPSPPPVSQSPQDLGREV